MTANQSRIPPSLQQWYQQHLQTMENTEPSENTPHRGAWVHTGQQFPNARSNAAAGRRGMVTPLVSSSHPYTGRRICKQGSTLYTTP